MANLPELFDIADQIQEDERRASLDQPSSSRSVNAQPQQTLGEEVNEVIGQLGRFWGGFQKQSSCFPDCKKGLRLGGTSSAEGGVLARNNATTQRDGPAGSGEASNSATASSTEPPAPISIDTKGKEKEVEDDTATIKSSSPTTDTTPGASATTGTFFSRLQANLPPQFAPAAITATLQSQLSTAQAQADALRTSLATNIQRIQQEGNMPISFAQAEKLAGEYVHRSEELLKGAGAFLKDAVHVIPAEGVDNTREWCGTVQICKWMMPSPMAPGTPTPEASASGRPALTHAEALLKRLKSDPEVLRVDPASSSAKERYEKYITGIDISDTQWTSRIREVIADTSEDSDSLLSTKEKLVPEAVSEDEFWKRYFFRVQQINEDEEKRKIILKAPTQPEDDFSWEDDEKPNSPINNDESNSTQPPTNPTTDLPPTHPSTSTTTLKTSTNDLAPPSPVPAAESATTPTATGPNSRSASQILIAHSGVSTSNTSPRESESSFDVVSASSSVAGMNADVADKKRSPDEKTKTDQKDDSDDSDWE
ncbi:BSD domain [Rhizoctonia solani]|uniref:BSD domain n=1 Tax=Rhizoctonia solani TaxID=456999 RepID=A0A8H7M6U1_9AGAM|nr:BSD domain [Rhizoctonia solani]